MGRTALGMHLGFFGSWPHNLFGQRYFALIHGTDVHLPPDPNGRTTTGALIVPQFHSSLMPLEINAKQIYESYSCVNTLMIRELTHQLKTSFAYFSTMLLLSVPSSHN